ncbi:MAG: hypothetical protein H6861_00575 [Rhodospirillales bacterium]|nr:hypothetical protein [Rhodospirillales bacterium]
MEVKFGLNYGEALFYRAVGAVIPDPEDEIASLPIKATLEHALENPHQVEIALLIPHTHCGAVKAHMTGEGPKALLTAMSGTTNFIGISDSIMTPEFKLVSDPVRVRKILRQGDLDEGVRHAVLRSAERACMDVSRDNLLKYPQIKEGLESGKFKLLTGLDDIACDNISFQMDGHSEGKNIIERFLRRYKNATEGLYDSKNGGRMPELVLNGQHPETLFISGLSGDLGRVFSVRIGDAFVHRHTFGLIPPPRQNTSQPDPLAAAIALSLHSGVKVFIHKFHADGTLEKYTKGDLPPYSTQWLEHCIPDLPKMKNDRVSLDEMRLHCMLKSIEHLKLYDGVQAALDAGKLSVLSLYEDPEKESFSFPIGIKLFC